MSHDPSASPRNSESFSRENGERRVNEEDWTLEEQRPFCSRLGGVIGFLIIFLTSKASLCGLSSNKA